MAKEPVKSKVVAATGVAVGLKGGAERAKKIEVAMTKAIEDANAKGITDPDKVRALMLKARDEAVSG